MRNPGNRRLLEGTTATRRHAARRWPRRAAATGALSLLIALGACGGQQPAAAPPETRALERPSPDPAPTKPPPAPEVDWAETTASPRPAPPSDPALAEWLAPCGPGEQALHEVAQAVAEQRDAAGAPPELEWTLHRLRQRGAPYVEPRVWSAVVDGNENVDARRLLADRIARWARREARGELRCGIGEVARSDGKRVLALLQVDARAELASLPTRAEPGQWLDVEARLLVPATDAAAVVLPPEGPPRSLHLHQEGVLRRTRFVVDRPGAWLLQILANDEGGALPALEARINVGPGPFPEPWLLAVPGETAQEASHADHEALLAMVNEARRLAGLQLLRVSPTLSALARHHAERMRTRGNISHDVGDGDPVRRVEEAGLTARRVGENVARAPTVSRAYRALWASPSHRGNLLFPHFDEVGIGTSRDAGGVLYASLLFIDSR